MTGADIANLTAWYEKNIGYLPNSIKFGLKYHPEFVKVNRGKWEVAIRTLPKHLRPSSCCAITRSPVRFRECARQLCWPNRGGITQKLIVQGITGSAMFFSNFEGLYAAFEALDDILDEKEARI